MRRFSIALLLAAALSSAAFAEVQPLAEVIKQNATSEHKVAVVVRPEKLFATPLLQQVLPPSIQASIEGKWQTIAIFADYDHEKRQRQTFEEIAAQLDSATNEGEDNANETKPEMEDATMVIARSLKPIAEKEVLQSLLEQVSNEFGRVGSSEQGEKMKFEALRLGGRTAHRVSVVYHNEWSYEIKGKAKVGRSDHESLIGYTIQLDPQTLLFCKTRKQLESSLRRSPPTELSLKLGELLDSDSAQVLVLASDVQANPLLNSSGLPAPSIKHVQTAIARLDVEGQKTVQLELIAGENRHAETLSNELNTLWQLGQQWLKNAPDFQGASEEDQRVLGQVRQAILELEIKAEGAKVVSYIPRPDNFEELVARVQKTIDRQVRPTQPTSIQAPATFKDIRAELELEEAGAN